MIVDSKWAYVSFDDINRKKRNFQLSHNQSAILSSYKEVINKSFLSDDSWQESFKLISPITKKQMTRGQAVFGSI